MKGFSQLVVSVCAMRRRLITLAALLGVAVTAALAVTNPVAAAGTPYSYTSWAGYRVTDWLDNYGNRPPPHVVTATWKVPCLPAGSDGVYGTYDIWTGIEDADGVSFIQAGVRSYHLNFGGGAVNGYYAWIVDTRSTNARTPRYEFWINNCGLNGENATVHAYVNANGNAWIYADNRSYNGEPRVWSENYWGPQMHPARGSFIVERYSQNLYIPWFDTAMFLDAYVGGDLSHGWSLGSTSDFVHKTPYYMVSLNPHPPWQPPSIAVVPTQTGPNGNFNLYQWSIN